MTRLTVRIPDELYQRFLAFAAGRSYHRGDTQLADSVRDALAHYLACPQKRLMRNSTASSDDTREQPIKSTEERSTDTQQTHNGTVPSVPLGLAEPSPLVRNIEQIQKSTENLLELDSNSLRQTQSTPPAPLDTADVDDMPLAPVTIPLQPVLDFDTRVWCLRSPGACGHTSHGEAGNRVRCSDPRKCWLCEAEAKAQKKAAQAHRPAPSMQEV